MPHPLNFSGVIPQEFSAQIIQEAIQQSIVLQLGNILPMGTAITDLPVPKTLPTASFTGAPGAKKPWTDVMLEPKTVHAEEVAAITAIPDAYLEDSTINLWGWVRPRLAEAIAVAIDNAVLFGVGAPVGTFPVGGLISNTYSVAIPAVGLDAVDGVNQGMAMVESQGIAVTGHAADLVTKSVLRGVRDQNGALLLGTDQVDGRQIPTLYGVPIVYQPWSNVANDFITGGWQNLVIGLRQDIRYNLDPSGVVTGAGGAVIVSGFESNTTPLKVWARVGCVIINPVTVKNPAGGRAFARGRLAQIAPPAPPLADDEGGSGTRASAKK
jgi:HK97 family phage major capsid protein